MKSAIKRQIIKIPALLLVALLLLPVGPAAAFVPLAIPVVVSAVIHVAAIGAGIYYYMTSGKSSTVTSTGDVKRPTTVAWVDLKNGVPTVETKSITAKQTFDRVKSMASASPSTYPVVSSKTSVTADSATTGTVLTNNLGQRVKYSSQTSGSMAPSTAASYAWGWNPSGTSYSYITSQTPYLVYYTVKAFSSTTDALSSVSPSSFATAVAPTGTVTDSAIQAELDKMMQDPNYVPTFTDDTTGLPYAPPADAWSDSKIQAYNTAGTTKEAAANAATAALDSANNAVTTAQSNYNANPSADNKLALDIAVAARDALVAQQARDAAAAADDGTGGQDTGGFDSPAYGDKTDADFNLGTRFKTFFDQMKTTAVFSLPNQFLNGLPSGGSSTMSFNGGRYGQHTFDFANSSLSPLWNALKGLLLVIFGWYSVKIVALKGGGG